jgi:8-oxo-dGTP pyrophosphatase MutT (NUDIX family)
MKKVAFVVMYILQGENGYDTELVMVRQDRDGRETIECAGGHVEDHETTPEGAVREVYEETGIKIPENRLNFLGSKFKHPSSGSMSYSFSCQLKPEEIEKIKNKAAKGKAHGVENEEIYLEVVRLMDLLNGNHTAYLDWATLGMILLAKRMDRFLG